jgi:hypothetical protein
VFEYLERRRAGIKIYQKAVIYVLNKAIFVNAVKTTFDNTFEYKFEIVNTTKFLEFWSDKEFLGVEFEHQAER